MRHRIFSRLRIVGLILLGLAMLAGRAEAQTGFGATVSATTVRTNSPITYTFSLTNLVIGSLQDVFITNIFSSGVNGVVVTNNYSSATASNLTDRLLLRVPNLDFSTPSIFTVTVFSTNTVSLTNFVFVSVQNALISFTTNLVTLVSNAAPVTTDLAVSIKGPEPDVHVGDYVTFGVTVTNLGSNTASGIVLSNSFFSGGIQSNAVGVRWISPASPPVINAFSLTNRAGRAFSFRVQPTNSGTLSFSALLTFGSDSNGTNNIASTNIVVSSFGTNALVVTQTSTQRFNAIVGVMEQSIVLSNASAASIPSARVKVGGIPSPFRLFNSVGTNQIASGDSAPFVVHGGTLAAGAVVDMWLQYKVPSHEQLTELTFEGQAMTNAADLTPPANLIALNATNQISFQGDYIQRVLLGFPTITGRSYTIVYSDDAGFTNPKVVRPSIVAPANWTYWLDYGSPATISAPAGASSRFYKIFLNP